MHDIDPFLFIAGVASESETDIICNCMLGTVDRLHQRSLIATVSQEAILVLYVLNQSFHV